MHVSAPLWVQSDDCGEVPPALGYGRGATEALPLDIAILIVEDEVLIAWTLHDMLIEIGFTDVRMARDANEAMELAGGRHPGLLICDVNLGSGDDGVAVASRIRAAAWVPVLFITGYAGDEIRERIDLAITGAPLMRKPIEPKPLAHCLGVALRGPKPH